jgi:hypothetical protein
MDVLERLRARCAEMAAEARNVRIERDAIPAYAASLPAEVSAPDPEVHLVVGTRERRAAFWLALDAINFGSGWFPTLRKRPGRSGYFTIAAGVREHGPWSAKELETITAPEIAAALGQDPGHELMDLFAASLNDLGRHVASEHDGRFAGLLDAADGSAVALVERLAGWDCFADPFLKRAQLAAADLASAGVAGFADLDRLTMFADNLVPHVLRLDGILSFEPQLVERIDRGELIEHGSAEEVEIRACALHAVELIVAALPGGRAADVDHILWNRGQGEIYKARPRHRTRCTAY